MKIPLVSCRQHVLWRLPRKKPGAGKFDSERTDGIFLGMAGTSSEACIGTVSGVEKANGFRLVVDEPYNIDDIFNFRT